MNRLHSWWDSLKEPKRTCVFFSVILACLLMISHPIGAVIVALLILLFVVTRIKYLKG